MRRRGQLKPGDGVFKRETNRASESSRV
jgi:hypothetical protein